MPACPVSRRHALKTLALGASSVFLPRGLRAAPSDQLRLAFVGAGGWARGAINGHVDQHYVAFCDVDEVRAASSYSNFNDVPRYRDVRKMLDRHAKEIDGVIITTPDHSHYPLTMACMAAGKHVYLEKPMATTAWECRRIAAGAAHYGVITQLGLQGHSAEGLRVLREWIEAGVVGPISDVWLWSDRTQPEISVWSETLPPGETPPATFDWRGWLADRPDRPYSPLYAPMRWRNWWGFGSGAICDIGMHMFDVVRMTLDTDFPEVVEADVSGLSHYTIPRWASLTWRFPAVGARPAFTLHWRNGWRGEEQNFPSAIPHLPSEVITQTKNGMAFVGAEGTLFIPDMRANRRPKLYPEAREADVLASPPAKRLPRVKGGHFLDWFDAIRAGHQAGANFAYGAALTEQVLLGVLAERTLTPIRWDAKRMRATGVPEADKFVRPERRRDAWEPARKDARHLPG
jgi:predicted dehydrogenase